MTAFFSCALYVNPHCFLFFCFVALQTKLTIELLCFHDAERFVVALHFTNFPEYFLNNCTMKWEGCFFKKICDKVYALGF